MEDQVTVEAATVTDASGRYKLFVEPAPHGGGYKDGNKPFHTSTKILATARNVFAVISLSRHRWYRVSQREVSIAQADQEQYATVSISRVLRCWIASLLQFPLLLPSQSKSNPSTWPTEARSQPTFLMGVTQRLSRRSERRRSCKPFTIVPNGTAISELSTFHSLCYKGHPRPLF